MEARNVQGSSNPTIGSTSTSPASDRVLASSGHTPAPSGHYLSPGARPQVERGEVIELQSVVVEGGGDMRPHPRAALSASHFHRPTIETLKQIIGQLNFRDVEALMRTSRFFKGLVQSNPQLQAAFQQLQQAHAAPDLIFQMRQTARAELDELSAIVHERRLAEQATDCRYGLLWSVAAGSACGSCFGALGAAISAIVFALEPTNPHLTDPHPWVQAIYDETYQQDLEEHFAPILTSLEALGGFGAVLVLAIVVAFLTCWRTGRAQEAREEAQANQLEKQTEVRQLNDQLANAREDVPLAVFHVATGDTVRAEDHQANSADAARAKSLVANSAFLSGNAQQVTQGVRQMVEAPESQMTREAKILALGKWRSLSPATNTAAPFAGLAALIKAVVESEQLTADEKYRICFEGVDLWSMWTDPRPAPRLVVLALLEGVSTATSPDAAVVNSLTPASWLRTLAVVDRAQLSAGGWSAARNQVIAEELQAAKQAAEQQ